MNKIMQQPDSLFQSGHYYMFKGGVGLFKPPKIAA